MTVSNAMTSRVRPRGRRRSLPAGQWVSRHRPFLVIFAVGAVLRLVTVVGYRPALWFPDSYTYVVTALRPRPDLVRPAGYSMFLRLLEPFHSFALVAVVQHLIGLLVGVLVYLTLRRHRVPAWAATTASAPVLLDAYQIELEHLLVSDTLFMLLVVAAVCLVLRRPLTAWVAAGLGVLLAAATLTRTVGLPLIALFAVFLGWYGSRVRTTAASSGTGTRPQGRTWRLVRLPVVFLVTALTPITAYGAWFFTTHHRVGLIGANGVFLYARTMAFADCAVMRPPADLAVLCDRRPPAARPPSQEYIWAADSPLVRLPGNTFIRETDALAGRFAWLAIRSQPGDYVAAALTELGRTFTWRRLVYPDPQTYGYYEFPVSPPPPAGRHPAVVGQRFAQQYEQGPIAVRVVEPYAGGMRAYQDVVFVPGMALLAVLLVPPACWVVRVARGQVKPGDGGALVWAVAWMLVGVPAATAQFDYRYVLPAVPVACLAAAFAVRRRG